MNISNEKFLSKFLKKLNTITSVKEVCKEVSLELLKITKAHACWFYLVDNEANCVLAKKIYYATDVDKSVQGEVEQIYTLGEDLFLNNYDMEDTLEYFYKLSKENVIIVPVIWRQFLFGYIALVGKRKDFNLKNHVMAEIIAECVDSRLEILTLKSELQRHNKDKIQFLASISHEYKTPLNSIIGFSDMLKHSLYGSANYKYIDNISKSSKFLLGLIQDILDMARSEFAEMELNYEVFRPKQLIEDIVLSFDEIIKSKNLHFSYTIMDVEIKADVRRFQQMVVNLISNAVKFNKLNGKIKIVVYINENNEFVFEVTDTGDGIRKRDYDKIFNFFSQVNSSHLKRQQGSGVGLALCKKIAEAHSGQIGFKSKLNHGSTFWFTIPQEIFKGNIQNN